MHLPHLTKGDTVEPLNKGHFGTALFFVRRLSSLEGAKCIKTIGRMYFGTSSCVLCREAYCTVS